MWRPDATPITDATAPDRLALRRREAAKALGISERLLWSLTNQGLVPQVRFGTKAIAYPVRELQDWLAEQAAGGRGCA
jgi:predicted DNA-binding transcriptional regulator AlpA